MEAAPKLMRLLSLCSLAALRAPPARVGAPRHLPVGPYASTTPPSLLPGCCPLPYGPSAPQAAPASASTPWYFRRPPDLPPPPRHLRSPASSLLPSSAPALPPRHLRSSAGSIPPSSVPALLPRHLRSPAASLSPSSAPAIPPRHHAIAPPLPTSSSAPPPWRGADVSSGGTPSSRSLTYARSSAAIRPVHRLLARAGLAGALAPTRSPDIISGMPTEWRYSPTRLFSTNDAAPTDENPRSSLAEVQHENCEKGSSHAEGKHENCEKVLDHFRKNEILIKVPDTSARSDYNLITANPSQPYMIKEDTKRSFRSLLLRIGRIHIENKCMSSPITVENILATSTGALLFSEEETEDQTEGVNKNWDDLKNCIVSMMTEIHGDEVIAKLPGGFNHLLGQMEKASCKRSYLLPNHTSLLPVATRAIAVLKIYMLLVEEMPKVDTSHDTLAKSILRKAADPFTTPGNHWYDIAKNDTMLSNWLNYRGGSMYKRDAKSLMALHRHVTHHCMEHKSKSRNYTYEAVQNLLDHAFQEFIPRLQSGLSDANLLQNLKLHTLFTSSPEPYDS